MPLSSNLTRFIFSRSPQNADMNAANSARTIRFVTIAATQSQARKTLSRFFNDPWDFDVVGEGGDVEPSQTAWDRTGGRQSAIMGGGPKRPRDSRPTHQALCRYAVGNVENREPTPEEEAQYPPRSQRAPHGYFVSGRTGQFVARVVQTFDRSVSGIGNSSICLPVAARIALATAAATGGTPGSPTPVGFSVD
jgi:hypothetical protein